MAQQRYNAYSNPAFCNQFDHSSPPNRIIPSRNGHDNFSYEGTATSPTFHRRIREPPAGAATNLRYAEQYNPHQRFEPWISDRVQPSSASNHRRQGSETSPNSSRRLIREFSPSRSFQQEIDLQSYQISPRKVAREPRSVPVSRRHSYISTPSRVLSPSKLSPNSTRRVLREYSPPRLPVQHHPLVSPSTPKRCQTMIPVSTPRKNPGNSPANTHQVTPKKIGKLISPLTTPQKRTQDAGPKTQHASPSRHATVYVMPEADVARSTAVVTPIYASSQSPQQESPQPPLKSSWIQMTPTYQAPPTGTLATAGVLLLICGAATIVLGFYLLATEGRRYFLDFALLSGVLSLLLGCLAFKARRWEWLPNRNYVSGYIVLSMFSLLTCTGLAVMTSLRPQPGLPLTDLVGGAVCGVTVLTVFLTTLGVVTSQCCRYPPPDNRVQHCAEGFSL